jgi:hypothetical protein
MTKFSNVQNKKAADIFSGGLAAQATLSEALSKAEESKVEGCFRDDLFILQN